ncbi:hypothetical protein BC830DRAFT_1125583 [Chytriomyces sp. MP71]|nr:hypothetical protein BC830DRAFT_1125583 [Chytriomyces sp. MP71]
MYPPTPFWHTCSNLVKPVCAFDALRRANRAPYLSKMYQLLVKELRDHQDDARQTRTAL